MYDMFDLPNETELAKVILEAKKQPSKTDNTIGVHDIFPFCQPLTEAKAKKNSNVVSDKTGVVKPKNDFRASDVITAWEDFKSNMKSKASANTGDGDKFGRLEVKNGDKIPTPEKVASAIKALQTTKVTGINGKTTSTTEELGLFREMAKTSATKLPDKTGAVEPKDGLGKIDKKPKIVDMSGATVVVKDAIPSKDNKLPDKTGAVKPKDGLGKIDKKPKVIDMSGATVVVKDKAPTKMPELPGTKIVVKDAIPSKGNTLPDKSGAVKPKKLETAK